MTYSNNSQQVVIYDNYSHYQVAPNALEIDPFEYDAMCDDIGEIYKDDLEQFLSSYSNFTNYPAYNNIVVVGYVGDSIEGFSNFTSIDDLIYFIMDMGEKYGCDFQVAVCDDKEHQYLNYWGLEVEYFMNDEVLFVLKVYTSDDVLKKEHIVDKESIENILLTCFIQYTGSASEMYDECQIMSPMQYIDSFYCEVD